MNFSTHFNARLTRSKPRQRIFSLTFFCFVILVLSFTSCSDNIFESPHGDQSLVIDTLHYDHQIISGIRNLNADASGSMLTENKAGNYHGLSAEFLIKFTNFLALTGLPDSVEMSIDKADVVLFPSNHWGTDPSFSLDLHMAGNDTSLYWENNADPRDVFSSLEGRTEFYGTETIDPAADSVSIPIDLETVNRWYKRPDSLYVNNGFIVRKNADSRGICAFYSAEHQTGDTDRRPRLRLECSLRDTNGVYLKDSTFYVMTGGDIQKAESNANIEDHRFYLSQGNIFRSYVMLDSIRQDTLLGPTRLLNRARQTFVINHRRSDITPGDTLYLTARLFKTDSWDTDSLQYMFTAYSNIFSTGEDTVSIDISQLLQYLVSNEKASAYEGVFFYLNNEYNDFNYITIDPEKSGLEVIYTKVVNE